jgi:hypothetical protein
MTPEPSGDPRFERWGVDESSVRIEYSLVAIEEIRHEVAQGLQRFSRGGLEVGGILYGTHSNGNVSIQAIRPMACEHREGPSFQLSDVDRAGLEAQLREDDPQLKGLTCVGWFVSHTRGDEIAMTAQDVEIYSRFFPQPWQVTLVIRPGRAGAMRAAFFVREADGTVQSERSYKEFNFPDRLAGVLDRIRDRPGGEPRAAFRTGQTIPVPSRHDPAPDVRPLPTPIFGQSQYMPSPPPANRKWPWIVAALAVLSVAGGMAAYRFYGLPQPAEPLAVTLLERDGALQIQWNPQARPVRDAAAGTLAIIDGGVPQNYALTREQLRDGKYVYSRKSGDVEVRVAVKNANGEQTEEGSRFLGRPPEEPANDALKAADAKRAALESEAERLRQENLGLRQQIQQLQRTQRILESRLGIK